jgi:hypothetical protein
MKNLIRSTIFVLTGLSAAFAQQNTIVQTSLSAAITADQTKFAIASATGVNAPSYASGLAGSVLYVVDWGQTKGEAMQVVSISSTTVTVKRGTIAGNKAVSHASGAMVLVATNANWFYSTDPVGSCTTAGTYATPWVNIQNGNQWLCSTITLTWVPGWGNTNAPAAATTAVASAAGLITPSGPLFHVTGTAAITGFNIPLGYNGGGFCIIPDGAFTTTTANNIAIASTGVASKLLCYGYDKAAAKPFFASY